MRTPITRGIAIRHAQSGTRSRKIPPTPHMSGVRITPLGCARFVGSQATIELEGRLTTHLTVWTFVVLFQAGAFLKDTSPGLNTCYLAGHATYRF